MKSAGVSIVLLGWVSIFAGQPASAAIQSFTPNATTLHLWHLDENSPPCVDAASGGTNLTYLISGVTLGNPAYSTNTVNFGNCLGFGTLTTSNAVAFPTGSGTVGTAIPFTYAGANGAFSYEALVHIEFNPASAVRNQPCQVMDCDADNTGTRVFQMRLDPVGFAAGGRDTSAVGLEFINGTTTVAAPPLPVTGPDAIVSNAWYHVAITYNGLANTTSNLLFYWTLVDPSRTNADCIYGTNMAASLPGTSSATTVFSLGNSARNPGGGTGPDLANFLGRIDEVRLSSVALPASQMLFIPNGIAVTEPPAPTNQVVGTDEPFSLTVAATGSALNYQWWFNGEPLPGATNRSYSVASAPLTDSGFYSVVITNQAYAVTSAVASVVVSNLAIIAQPVSVTAAYAQTATFTVGAVGLPPLAWQWRKDGSPLPGATNSSLLLPQLQTSDAGSYDVLVTNALAALDSVTVTLNLNGPPISLIPVFDGTNAAASGYAYAGSSDINAVAFICSGLRTVGNQQFFAYYGQHQTDPSYLYNGTIWIARRTVGTGVWQIFRTPFTPDDITDGHDVVAFGIDGAGYLHLSWGMHDQALHYARSTGPVTGTNAIIVGPDLGNMTGNETSVTYPQFLNLPNGDLLYLYRVGASGGGNTFFNRWLLASQTWTNVNVSAGVALPLIQGLWASSNYNAYPNLPCVDTFGNLYLAWTWRETPAYESNHDLNYAKSTNGGLTWLRYNGTPYDLPICENGQTDDTNQFSQIIVPIPQNSSLINQAGMCLDASNNPVLATWWAPGTPTNNYRRQYVVVFPDTNGVWQTRQVSHRTNDPPGTLEEDAVVRDLGRPVVVCDRQNRILVLERDNSGSNGLTIIASRPYALDPQRTNWTAFTLTTDNLGNYEPVIDLARWQRDNVLDIVYQSSSGEGYTPNANDASPMGVLEWNESVWANPTPALQLTLANSNRDVALAWNAQPGWGYQVQWSTNLINWNAVATFNGITSYAPLQFVQTNGAAGSLAFWRLQLQPGGF